MLEETGLPYEPHMVSFETRDQMSPNSSRSAPTADSGAVLI